MGEKISEVLEAKGGGLKLPNEVGLHEKVEELKSFCFILNAAIAARHWTSLE